MTTAKLLVSRRVIGSCARRYARMSRDEIEIHALRFCCRYIEMHNVSDDGYIVCAIFYRVRSQRLVKKVNVDLQLTEVSIAV